MPVSCKLTLFGALFACLWYHQLFFTEENYLASVHSRIFRIQTKDIQANIVEVASWHEARRLWQRISINGPVNLEESIDYVIPVVSEKIKILTLSVGSLTGTKRQSSRTASASVASSIFWKSYGNMHVLMCSCSRELKPKKPWAVQWMSVVGTSSPELVAGSPHGSPFPGSSPKTIHAAYRGRYFALLKNQQFLVYC